MRQAGTPEAWLQAQLHPETLAETPKVAEVDSWYSAQSQSPAQKYANATNGVMPSWKYRLDLGNNAILRRIYSERAVLETMTDFWSTHFHVPVTHDIAWIYRADYAATIRANALGTFEDLLIACSLHPAMRAYLDNWRSVKNRPNENQGRELLELHTVGLGAGYTESMVKDSAKILSGYTLDWGKSFAPIYNFNAHTTGPVSVLGFTHANGSADGQAVTIAYLKYLAHHPATARRIATKLATYFVADNPSQGLIGALADAYSKSGADIRTVLNTLAAHPEFLTSEGRKVPTPMDDLVSTTRILEVEVTKPISDNSWANAITSLHGAGTLYSWPRPDGPPIDSAMWSTPSRVFASFQMHALLAGGAVKEGALYRTYASWLPAIPSDAALRFDAYVDHLCRRWLGKGADARLLDVAAQAVTGPQKGATIDAATEITSAHQVAGALFPRLVMALLDTPDHMTS